MLFFNLVAVATAAATLLPGVFGVASTDEYRDADQLQSGYLPNHNMDPNAVNSASFGQLWRVFTGGTDTTAGDGGGNEQFMAKPLVYTTLKGGYGGKQVVIACSETNWIYVLDAVNGTIYSRRQLHRPFLASDIGCNDVNPQIGITGTPIIDPQTDVMYVYSKTYIGAANGYQNGIYYFHAIDVNTLADVYPPVNVNGGPASNDPNEGIYFTGGTHLQRTSLSLINGAVYAGFGGHCDLFNYTGWVIGIDAPTGTVLTRFATEVGSFAPAQDGTNDYSGGGGGSGIWQSGMSLTSDSQNRLFFVTGNDRAHANIEQPASGRAFLGTLGQAIVNLAIDPTTRQLSLTDYFEPYEYISMDGGDRDLGSGGICGLDSTVFKGNNVAQIGVAIGKNGKAYVVNMDNLGGFKNGANGGDLVIQTLVMPGGGPIFGGAGSYPLEGGYLYMTPIGYATQVYKFVLDVDGNPSFTLVSQTPDISSGRVGAGVPTITTNGGSPGTAILWVTDVDAGLRAYYAVPRSDGSMKKINMPPTPALNKYQRPAFGDGRLYLSTSDGHIICLGSPVAQPFTCSVPIDFGSVTIGSTSTLLINCTANIPIARIVGLSLTNPLFTALNSSLPMDPLNIGQAFSFPATYNLTAASIQDTVNTSYSGVKPGVAAGAITLYTVNSVEGYVTSQPLAIFGTAVSQSGFLSLSPVEVDFGGLVVNSIAAQAGLSDSLIISNEGVGNLTITGSSWADPRVPTSVDVNITQIGSTGQYGVGPAFNATDWPQTGYVIRGGSSISIPLSFNAASVGTYGSIITIWSTGGSPQTVILSGTMSNAPIAVLTVNNGEGGAWQPSITGTTQDPSDGSIITQVGVNFGNLYPGNSSIITLGLNNTGGSALLVTKSKPPEGVELTAVNPTGDLPEGAQISPNSYADGPVIFSPSLALSPPNSDPRIVSGTWTLNNNDLTFGVHVVNFTGTVIVAQHGPLNSAGNSIFKYLGCYLDSANGGPRLLPDSTDNGVSNENGLCQNQAFASGAVFAGTEYHTQCWWGNGIPNITFYTPESANRCTWACPADSTQPCGGNGGYISVFYDSTKYNPSTGACTGCSAPATHVGDGGNTVTGVIEKTVGSYNYVGCYTEVTTGRALSSAAYAYNSMTPNTCAANCTGYSYFGVEYGRECYCGNILSPGSVIAPNGDSECNMPCMGNTTEFCGAGSRLTLYYTNTITAPGTYAPTGAANKAIVGAYSYHGCQTESTVGRALGGASFAYNTMTLESCMANCTGFSMFGTEYGRECYCGNFFNAGSVPAPSTDCDFPCPGDGTELCGAGSRLSVYMLNSSAQGNTTTTVPSQHKPTIKEVIGLYSYYGCQTEATTGRALNSLTYASNNMTLELCIATCASFTYAGVEYGRECYCGNSFNAGSVVAPGGDADCSMICPGNNLEFCGAAQRLSVYKANMTTGSSFSLTSIVTTSTSLTTSLSSSLISSLSIIYSPSTSFSLSTSSGSGASSSSGTTSSASITFSSSITSSPSSTSSSIIISSLGAISSSGATSSSSDTSSSSITSGPSSTSSSSAASSPSFTSHPSTTSSSNATPNSSVTPSSSIAPNPSSTSSSSATSNPSATSDSSITLSSSIMSSLSSTSSSSDISGLSTTSGSSITLSPSSTSSSSTTSSPSSTSNSSTASSSSATPSLSITSFSTTGSPVATPSPSGLSHIKSVGNYIWIGCYTEATDTRALNSDTLINYNTMTVEICASFCGPTYSMFGVEYSGECYCGSTLEPGSVLAPTSDCSMTCDGNSQEYCGAGNRLDVYQLNGPSPIDYTGPPVISQGNSNFSYYDCLGEPVVGRALTQIVESNAVAMTVERCLGECWQYQFAGVEFGQECWCGNSITTGTLFNQTDCTMPCTGNSSEFCGGRVHLSAYERKH